MKNNKLLGVILSYTLAVVDVVVALFFIPFLLSALGDTNYGAYKLMQSTASYLSVLDFGIGSTITRYIVKYKVKKQLDEERNFLAMGLLVYGAISLVIMAISLVVAALIPSMYATSIPQDILPMAQTLFLIICVTTVLSLFNHAFNGLLIAYERFSLASLLNIIKILFRVFFIVFGLKIFSSPLLVVTIDAIAEGLLLLFTALYSSIGLKCKPKLSHWDWPLAKEAFIFTLAIFFQSIINQFNTNLDNIVLGVFTTAATVSMYSMVLQIYTLYSTVATSISTVYLPSISAMVFEDKSDDEITDAVIFPSRIQLIILLLVYTGFLILGKDFVGLWINRDGYSDVYGLGCLLLGAATFELSQTTITSVLKAKNILHGRSIILAVFTLLNAVITVALVPVLGPYGAAIGTAFSLVFGYGIVLGWYYARVAKLNMKKYYKSVYAKIVPTALLNLLVGGAFVWIIPVGGVIGFLLKGIVYVITYIAIMYFIAMSKQEKALAGAAFKKIKHKFGRA